MTKNLMNQKDRLEILQALTALIDILRGVERWAPPEVRNMLAERLERIEEAAENLAAIDW